MCGHRQLSTFALTMYRKEVDVDGAKVKVGAASDRPPRPPGDIVEYVDGLCGDIAQTSGTRPARSAFRACTRPTTSARRPASWCAPLSSAGLSSRAQLTCVLGQVFDVTRKVTYQNLPNWYQELREYCENIPCFLVANKIDVDLNVRGHACCPRLSPS
jgi:hypothetical protein